MFPGLQLWIPLCSGAISSPILLLFRWYTIGTGFLCACIDHRFMYVTSHARINPTLMYVTPCARIKPPLMYVTSYARAKPGLSYVAFMLVVTQVSVCNLMCSR